MVGTEIVGELDPNDEFQEILALPPMMSVTELVKRKLADEEEVLKDAKAAQAKSSLAFAKNFRAMKAEEKAAQNKLESSVG
jgi:hypothetical protein